MSVLGLDLSLTSTGVCLIDGELTLTAAIKSKAFKKVKKTDKVPPSFTCQRISNIVNEIEQGYVRSGRGWPELAVIEAPSYGSNTGSQHERGGLWWAVAGMLWGLRIPIATVAPQGRAKYATGSGTAGKDEVLAAAIKRYIDIDIKSNDVADAVILAAMGARHLGQSVDDVPQANLAAMVGAQWPS